MYTIYINVYKYTHKPLNYNIKYYNYIIIIIIISIILYLITYK